MAGPFDRFQSEWVKMRPSEAFEDRREESWPWHPQGKQVPTQTLSPEQLLHLAEGRYSTEYVPPVTGLSRDAGATKIGPLPDEEVLQFILNIDRMNNYGGR